MAIGLWIGTVLAAVAAIPFLAWPAAAIEFGLPAGCELGRDCFVQQFPDMDPGQAASDPFCGNATYDAHSGTDLRVIAMPDIERGVPVVAMADGTVLRLRDGVEDRLVGDETSRAAVADRECGNGVIVAHADGYETQYCHLRNGSIAVEAGRTVRRGDRLGEIGASGMAEFPHVHVDVRKDGIELDPSTGRRLDAGCDADSGIGDSLFAPEVAQAIGRGGSELLAFGLSGDMIDHGSLVAEGPPQTANAGSEVTLGWAWFINLREGDRIRFRILQPDGSLFVEQIGDPVDAAKADYSAFAGRRRPAVAGPYEVTVDLLRGEESVLERTGRFEVR